MKIADKAGRVMMATIAAAGVFLFAWMFFVAAEYYSSACHRGVFVFSDILRTFLAVGVVWVLLWTITGRLKMNPFWTAILVSFLAFAAHVAVIRLTHALYDQVMYSDFLRVQNCVESESVMFSHRPEFFYWCNFELFVSFLGKVFCRDMQVVQYLNALACALAVFPLCLLSERVSNRGLALLTSLLFGLSPSMLMYSMMMTSEFVGMALLFWSFWLFVEMLHAQGDVKQALAMAAVVGILLAGCQLMKPVVILFVCAAGLVVLRLSMLSRRRRAVVCLWGSFLVMFVVYKCVFSGGQYAFSEIAGPKVELKAKMSIPRALAVGLNVDSGGAFDTKFCSNLYNMSEPEVRNCLNESIKRNLVKYPSLFVQKLSTLYSHEWWGFGCYTNSLKPRRIQPWVQRFVASWYVLAVVISMFGMVGLVFCLLKRGLCSETWPGVLAVLMVLAFTALEMLIEVQGRYRSIVYPFYFMVIPYCGSILWVDNPGLAKIWQLFKRRVACEKN